MSDLIFFSCANALLIPLIVLQSISPTIVEKILASDDVKEQTVAKYTDILIAVVESAAAPEPESPPQVGEPEEDPLEFVGSMMPDDLEASSSLRKLFDTLDAYPDKRFLVYSSW